MIRLSRSDPMKFQNIVSIHGAPRSGTSWLGQIFDSCPSVRYKFQPLFSYTFKDRINVRSNKEEILDFYNRLYECTDDFLDQRDKKENGTYPTFKFKSAEPEYLVTKMVRYHYLIPQLIEKLNNIKFVAIVRHPCGVLNSWRKAPREFLEGWDFNAEWRFAQSKNKYRPEEYYGFHKWLESTKLFLEMEENFPDTFKLIRYEDLVQNPMNVTEELFHFAGLTISEQSNEFLNESTALNKQGAYSVYKGAKNVNEWETELDSCITENVINEIKGTEFERFI
jgi:hypothetical protein